MKLATLIIGTILLCSLVSAYNGWGYGWPWSPSDLLNNEWVLFFGIFLLVFTVVYLSVSRMFTSVKSKENFPWIKEKKIATGPAAVISLVVALFVAAAVSQKIRVYGYFGEEIGSWIIIFAVLLAVAFLMKLSHDRFKPYGVPVLLIIIWFILFKVEPYDFLPSSFITYQVEQIYSYIISYFTLAILVAITLILMLRKKEGKKRK